MIPFEDPKFVASFLEKRQLAKSINNAVDTPLILDLMGDLSNKSVVEIGCSAGDFCTNLLATSLKSYHGIDVSAVLIRKARERIRDPRFHFETLDVCTGSLNASKVDIVISGLVLHFIEDANLVFGLIRRIMKGNGVLAFSVRHPFRTSNPSEKASKSSWTIADYFDEGPRSYIWHEASFVLYHRTLTTWIALLSQNNLQILSIKEPRPLASEILPEDNDHASIPGVLAFKCLAV